MVKYGPYAKSGSLGKGRGRQNPQGEQLGPYCSQAKLNKQSSHKNNGGRGKSRNTSY